MHRLMHLLMNYGSEVINRSTVNNMSYEKESVMSKPLFTQAIHAKLFVALMFLCSFTFVSNLHAQANNIDKLQQAYDDAMKDWAYVLKTYVDAQGRTNFKDVAQDIEPLENVVAFIGEVSPASTPSLFPNADAVMAFHINSYNALAMYGVIERDIPDGFTNFFSRASFFKFRDVTIGGQTTNLYDYENDVIRPLNEPRAHFALNCMVKDCPRLPMEPFEANSLNATLDELTNEFFAKEKHLYFDHDKKRVYVSEILDFYTEDFVVSGKAKDLPEYINQYLDTPIPSDYKLRFIEYDWRINAQP